MTMNTTSCMLKLHGLLITDSARRMLRIDDTWKEGERRAEKGALALPCYLIKDGFLLAANARHCTNQVRTE